MALDIVVDPKQDKGGADQYRESPGSSLVNWIMERVEEWEQHRKQNFDTRWDEYYRLWRGIWAQADKSRDSERSKIITPALAQAVESTVAELEEATFGQGKWFDVSDNYSDEDKTDIAMWRDQMAEDCTKEDVESRMSEIYLNGALYGTGIGKIVLNEVVNRKIIPRTIGDTDISTVDIQEENTIRVGLQAVHPKEFVIDPTARTIDEALGMAHITDVPRHTILKGMASGIYRDVVLSHYTDTIVGNTKSDTTNDLKTIDEENKTLLIEYHGLVPKYLLEQIDSEDEEMDTSDLTDEDGDTVDTESLVEAIVTIANSGTLLRAVENPYIMGDRCFMAYQHDTVPNRFWGRGICEKGYNPQKALDAEARGRIDAMALSIHPMMAMDATRIARGTDFKIAPGKNVFTNGDPRQILMPFNFGQVNPSTFSQSADLERQVQMGTGAMDSATPIADNARNATSGGMSMIQGGAIKRSKRTLANIERRFTRPFVNKMAWRYMQFAPERYPVQDIEFNVHSTLGIMARELEQAQLANMMKTVPSESPAFWMLLKGVFEHGNTSNREEMLTVVDQMMQQSLQKQMQPPEPDPLVQIKMQEMQIDAKLEEARIHQKADKDNKDLAIAVEKLKIEREALRLKERDMILDAKLQLAEQEQDSLVTAVQMSQKETKDQMEMLIKLQEQAAKAPQQKPQVININGKEAALAARRKKVKVTRTADGLEGSLEDLED